MAFSTNDSDVKLTCSNLSGHSLTVLCLCSVRQVVDVGLSRRLSNEVHMYTALVEAESGLVEGPSAASLRTANKRFMHACRTDVVPHITPGYVWVRTF